MKKICWLLHVSHTHTHIELDDDEASNLKFNNGHTLTYSMNKNNEILLNHCANNTIDFNRETERKETCTQIVRFSHLRSDWTSSQSSVCLRWFPVFLSIKHRACECITIVLLFLLTFHSSLQRQHHVFHSKFYRRKRYIHNLVGWFVSFSTIDYLRDSV